MLLKNFSLKIIYTLKFSFLNNVHKVNKFHATDLGAQWYFPLYPLSCPHSWFPHSLPYSCFLLSNLYNDTLFILLCNHRLNTSLGKYINTQPVGKKQNKTKSKHPTIPQQYRPRIRSAKLSHPCEWDNIIVHGFGLHSWTVIILTALKMFSLDI